METDSSVTSIIQYKESIPVNDIFKICILNDTNTISKMFVFQGSDKPIANDSEIFSEYEKLQNNTGEFTIIPSIMQIHRDDPIHVIKKKILRELNIPLLCYGELYMFSNTEVSIFLHDLYMEVTNNDSKPLTLSIIGQLLMNLKIYNEETLSFFVDINRPTITYNEFMKGLSNYTDNIEVSIPIGQRFSLKRDLTFSSNPYHILQSSPLVFQPSVNNPLLMFDNHLLLTYGNIVNNTIYLCIADDVLKYGEQNMIQDSFLLKSYFPILAKRDINSKDDLIKNKPAIFTETQKLMHKKVFDRYTNIDIFHDTYNTRKEELKYTKRGLYSFDLTLHPVTKQIFPLDSVFKQIHATESMPYIKYNPGYRREPIYRFYSIERTKNGKKIPVLTRTQINVFSKLTGKSKQISFVIKYLNDNSPEHLLLHINQNGNIVMNGSCTKPILPKQLNTLLIETINPILLNINELLDSVGYSIAPFRDIFDERIEYNNLKYICGLPLINNIKPNELSVLLSNMFHVYEPDIKKGAILRYKRVENYTEMDAMNALITQIYKNTNSIVDIKKAIVDNFSLTEDEANSKITSFFNDHIVINGNYVNKSVDIVDNPGFPTLIHTTREFGVNEIDFEITDINAISYIDQLHIYIDSFLRITQYPELTSINKNELIKIMSKDAKTEDVPVQDNVITTTISDIKPFALDNSNIEEAEDVEEQGIMFNYELDDDDDESENDNDEENKAVVTNDTKLLFMDDDDDDDDDDVFKMSGGGVFFDKMKNLEPTLFRTKREGKFDSYARACPSHSSRQPIILTKDELDELDDDMYEVAMPYGSDKDKPYWYICPRYWCLKTNKPMTDKQVADGECGGKILHGQTKKPIPGHYIYEFTDDRQHKDNANNYRQHRPGFQDGCLPCCFKEMNSEQQINRRATCGVTNNSLRGHKETINKLIKPIGNTSSNEIEEVNDPEDIEKKTTRIGANILGFDKFPIDKSRWGFLPLSVELFLHTDNSTSVAKNNSALIRKGETPLLRYGIEYSQNQSFVACIADIYTYKHNIDTPSIKEMRKIIISHITLDLFITCNNGSLVSVFQPKKTIIDDITVEKYKDTKFYKSFSDLNNTSQNSFLKDTIASYLEFRKFLKNDDSFIDHTYLWDLLCSVDTNIFPGGINIAMLEVVDNDITDNVALICPTNSYSNTMYDLNKGTCIVIKHNELYEPIYMYGNTNINKISKKNAVKIFYSQNTPPNLLNVFNMINKTTDAYCKPVNSIPTVYEYKRNLNALTIYNILLQKRFHINSQVRNYRGKTIALMVSNRKEDNDHIYIPTDPSSTLNNVTSIFTDAVKWLNYENTRDKLLVIAEKTNGEIFCKPSVKVIEGGLIVGIFTETNQFIQINTPTENFGNDGIPEYNTNGYKDGEYYEADKSFATDSTRDNTRSQNVRNISLETQFYTTFRSKLRSLLSNYKYKLLKDAIIETINNKQYLYKIKMKKLEIIIRYIMKPHVSFIDFDDTILDNINNMKTIINKDDLKQICLSSNKSMCIPSKNLTTSVNNDNLYFLRICDELLRYNRIRLFLLDTNRFLNINNIEYSIHENELLMLQSLITAEELDNLKPIPNNKYINHFPRDFANPINSNLTSPDVHIEQQYADSANATLKLLHKSCIKDTIPISSIKMGKWSNILHDNAFEHTSNTTTSCSFYPLIFIMNDHLNINENIYQIKERLCSYYKPLFDKYLLQVCNILELQGKRTFVNLLKKRKITIETMIMNDNYIITAMDIWVFADALKLPIILFDDNGFNNFIPNIDWLTLSGVHDTDAFYFIRIVSNSSFHLITPPSALRDLNGFGELINDTEYDKHIQPITDYLPNHVFTVPKLNIRKTKVKK